MADKKEGVKCGDTCNCENNKQCAYNHLIGNIMTKQRPLDKELTEKQECIIDVDNERLNKAIGQIFDNNFDCYADAEGELMPVAAMTKEKFVNIISKFSLKLHDFI